MQKNVTENKYLLSSVKNALLILNSFTMDHPEWGIRELAKHLNVAPSTIQRLLITLASEGYVAQDSTTKKFRLGVRLLAFSNIITQHLEIHTEALPVLHKIVQKTGETAHIGVLEGTKHVYLHKIEPNRPIRVFTEVGKQVPCYAVAGGKVILAFQDEKKIDQVISEGLIQFTNKTLTNPEALRDNLREIRENGYATSCGEFLKEEEILSIAAPIYDYTGKVFACLSLVGIAQRISPDLRKKYT